METFLTILKYAILAIHVVGCVLLVLLVLMQRPRNEGLGAAFGGSVTDSLFGAQTSDVLVKGTIILGCSFFLFTLGLASIEAHRKPSAVEELTKPAPAAVETQPEVSTLPANVSTNAPATPLAPQKPAPASPK